MIEIYKFYVDPTEELTAASIGRILRVFTTTVQPAIIKSKGYYEGTGQEIMSRVAEDPSRPNNKIVTNYCASIVDNFQGYLTGKPITYAGKGTEDISTLLEILRANDVDNSDSVFMRNGLIAGKAYQLCYVNKNNEKKFKNLDSECVVPVYSNDLDEELLYCIYFYPITTWKEDVFETRFSINVYDTTNIYHYESDSAFCNVVVADEPEEHHFTRVPFVVFDLNDSNTPIFQKVITLQDAYNTLLSDGVNDFEAFVDAYMVLKNVSATAEELAEMKESRTILIDGEDEVSYLTKNSADTQIQQLMDDIRTNIHTISNSPDFSSEEFNSGVSSGVALQFKLVGFSNVASNIESQFRKALNDRIDLINQIVYLTDTRSYEVSITFTYNLPSSISDTVEMVNSLRGLVSDETLLAQLPFIGDVEKEKERITAQNSAVFDVYSFSEGD